MRLYRCQNRYVKAYKKGKGEKYLEAVKKDGFLDELDVLEGRAIATNNMDPDWAENAGIVFPDQGSSDTGVSVGKVGGSSSRRPRNPRPVELADPLKLHQCRNRFKKAKDKHAYLDALR